VTWQSLGSTNATPSVLFRCGLRVGAKQKDSARDAEPPTLRNDAVRMAAVAVAQQGRWLSGGVFTK